MKIEKGETKSEMRTLQSNYLTGRFEHTLDIKRRLIVPATWRDTMGMPRYVFIMRSPLNSSLLLVPPFEMERKMEKIREKSLFDREASDALRVLGENSEPVLLDIQGRIRISDRMMAFAQLTGKVVMIGMGGKAEIWSAALRPPEEMGQESYAASMSKLEHMGF